MMPRLAYLTIIIVVLCISACSELGDDNSYTQDNLTAVDELVQSINKEGKMQELKKMACFSAASSGSCEEELADYDFITAAECCISYDICCGK